MKGPRLLLSFPSLSAVAYSLFSCGRRRLSPHVGLFGIFSGHGGFVVCFGLAEGGG
jgi:hypothetical protein